MWAHEQHLELREGASGEKDHTGCGIRQIPECCPQTRRETGLGKARGEIAAPVEIGEGGSRGLPAIQAAAETRCHVILAGDALMRQIHALPGLCRAGGSGQVMQGTGTSPNLLLLS